MKERFEPTRLKILSLQQFVKQANHDLANRNKGFARKIGQDNSLSKSLNDLVKQI
jgi:hypothetical protein